MPGSVNAVQQNVVVDGANLAYRTYHAMKHIPNPLTDADGNPTGLLFGFLRSLATLKSRFPKHNFYVVWEGSRQRRTSRYPEYKGTRSKTDIFSDGQMAAVQKVLPMLGVYQARNADEEADDVVASLVRGELRGHHNIIMSNDHDFLQLVTYTDQLLVPKVGNRPEQLYDPDRVVAEYGVPPERIVYLRALLGDTSDNLPGVPSVPAKLLTSLLRVHQTIDGIFSSNMAGLTASQYEKLRASEGLVRLNLELMPLQEVPYSLTDPSVNSDSAKLLLASRGIQPDSIIDAFVTEEGSSRGFVKTGEHQVTA